MAVFPPVDDVACKVHHFAALQSDMHFLKSQRVIMLILLSCFLKNIFIMYQMKVRYTCACRCVCFARVYRL